MLLWAVTSSRPILSLRLLLIQTCRVFLYQVFFMTAISLPSCFGEPLGDVMHCMGMCGNYWYLTTRYSYSPKIAMFLLLLNVLLFLLV